MPLFEWNQEITFFGIEDAFKNYRIRVEKDKVEAGVVLNFLYCDRISGDNQLRDFSFEFSMYLN